MGVLGKCGVGWEAMSRLAEEIFFGGNIIVMKGFGDLCIAYNINSYFQCRKSQLEWPTTYRVGHLKSWIHHSENFIAVTGLQTDNVVDDIVHLIKKKKEK